MRYTHFLVLTLFPLTVFGQSKKIILTNDDGWAVNLVRTTNDALKAAAFNVVLSSPADNRSGTGSSTAPPTVLASPCEFNTCPAGSPAVGFNASDPKLNYVNSFPVDAVRFGIQTLAPKFFSSPPDFVVSGPNVGNNLGSGVTGSGTVGAACEAALEGIPSIATSASGSSTSQISYTTLQSDPNSALSRAAILYAGLVTKITTALVTAGPTPILPRNITVNVNFPPTTATTCSAVDDFKFVLTRIVADSTAVDVETCGTTSLPAETTVVATSGCWVSVSVMNATTKRDVDAATQEFLLDRLNGFLQCFTA